MEELKESAVSGAPAGAAWIWSSKSGAGRMRTVLFRRVFEVKAAAQSAELHLFADTRYRLVVNGTVLGHGPARFHLQAPLFDTWDIGPWLVRGRNVIAVAVQSYGCGTFHSDPSTGGLIAWGGAEAKGAARISFDTGPDWKAHETPAYRRDTPRMSFALQPAESLDLRDLPDGWESAAFDDSGWAAATPLADTANWGPLAPRFFPLLEERVLRPSAKPWRLSLAERRDETAYSVVLCPKDGDTGTLRNGSVAGWVYVWSPATQAVLGGSSCGRLWLNGLKVPGTGRGPWEARYDIELRLKTGWNLLAVADGVQGDVWEWTLALPKAADLTLGAEPVTASPVEFNYRGPWAPGTEDVGPAFDNVADPLRFRLPDGGGGRLPMDRDYPAPWIWRAWRAAAVAPEETAPAGAPAWVYDFGRVVLGRPCVEFTAPAGAEIELHGTERCEDGVPRHGVQNTRLSQRCVSRGGRQVWRLLHPIGFRYLEVAVPGAAAGVEIHSVTATRARYPSRFAGEFRCSDPVLTRIWEIGRDTVMYHIEDAYSDSPWRERCGYTGDMIIEHLLHWGVTGDRLLTRRSIQLLMQTQCETGIPAPCTHGLPAGRHPDYSALAAHLLWVHWATTGDTDLVKEEAGRLRKLMSGLEGFERPGACLADATDRAPYIALCAVDREGVSCALNCLHQMAFANAAELFAAAGLKNDAAEMKKKAAARLQAVRAAFWDAEAGVFVDRLRADVPWTGPSVPGNAAALYCGIASAEQETTALPWLLRAIRDNPRRTPATRHEDWSVSPYFGFFVLGALYARGLAENAERFIRDNWRRQMEAGATSWWEHFHDPGNSLCHAWAGSPTHYLSTEVLGVRIAAPGKPDTIRIAPRPGTLEWAEGVFAHARGPVWVSWRNDRGRLELQWDAPLGVKVETA